MVAVRLSIKLPTRLFLCLVLSLPLASKAAPITVPTDLNPGDEYRLAFVTTTVRDATSSDIADYNAFVTAVAAGVPELAGLGTTWTAIASTATVAARDNTGTNPTVSVGVPIYLLSDTRIADDNADLWDGSIAERLWINEGGGVSSVQPWTGTTAAGLSDPSFPLGALNARSGYTFEVDSQWIEYPAAYSSSGGLQLYAISGELTVVPEPSTVVLALLSLALLPVIARRQRRTLSVGAALIVVVAAVDPSFARADPIVVPIDPAGSYLRADGPVTAAAPIDLEALDIHPGDILRLERLGDWEAGAGINIDGFTSLLGLFSSSDTLLSEASLNRVPDAIDTGTDVVTFPTLFGNTPTDIPEDFAISSEYNDIPFVSFTIIEVPSSATHLFVVVHDSQYTDNSDPDGNLELQIEVVPEPSTALLAGCGLGVVAVIAVRGRVRRQRRIGGMNVC